MFGKILIANRGEIAVRIARTARRLGVRTVAVYADVDREAMHVSACDEAYYIGTAALRESYLRGERILQVAQQVGAEAIHPGYGLLSENEEFARACTAEKLVFIGPPPSAIEAMGLKAASKRLMAAAGVPLIPGYHGAEQGASWLLAEARQIGFPVLIKASAGGGGKGMKVAHDEASFLSELASAKREAHNAFGDDSVLIERYLSQARHIEIQIFADSYGNYVYLFERDCSLQRRYQKIIEEAPAPHMSAAQRKQMGDMAVAAAKAVNYVGAGTVEFIAEHDFVSSGRFYFMEMNTRLQVEHPVTEMITGIDLVEWQLRIAAGERLPKLQNELSVNGHAFEARIYAENPRNQFLPATGRIERLCMPTENEQLRIDTGVREGDLITPYYDPMLAKLIVHGDSRDQALRRLVLALNDYAVLGLATNVELLQRIACHPEFIAAKVDTGFIARYADDLLSTALSLPAAVLIAAAMFELNDIRNRTMKAAHVQGEPDSPWAMVDAFWLNQAESGVRFCYRNGECLPEHSVYVTNIDDDDCRVHFGSGETFQIKSVVDGEKITLTLEGVQYCFRVISLGSCRAVLTDGGRYELTLVDSYAVQTTADDDGEHLTAPMPGSVVSVLVAAGEQVKKGQVLIIMEAMKMEHNIVAPFDGVVETIYYVATEPVKEGATLIAMAK